MSVIPDAWLDFRITQAGQTFQSCLALELDRGTLAKGRWQQRMQALVAWAKGPYQQAFKTTSLTMAVVATPGHKRSADLLTWTKEILVRPGEEPLG